MSDDTTTEYQTSTNEDWRSSLPEPLRDAPFIGKANDLDDAVGKLAHAAKLVGTSIRIPGEDASDEDKVRFYEKLSEVPGVARLPDPNSAEDMAKLLAKLGAPDEPQKYKMPEVDDFEWDEDVANDLRRYAQQAGMTPVQFEIFSKQIAEQERNADSESQREMEEQRKQLRLDWGETLESRENLIRGWLNKSEAPESMRELLDNRSLPLDTMNWLLSVAEQFKGDVSPVSKDAPQEPELDPTSAREEISKILNDPAYFNAADPRHKDLVNKMVKMQRLANPKQAA